MDWKAPTKTDLMQWRYLLLREPQLFIDRYCGHAGELRVGVLKSH